MRRNGTRFALISLGERGHQTLLLRLSAVLRNAVIRCAKLRTNCNCFHKTTWPEFRPLLPPGLGVGSESCSHVRGAPCDHPAPAPREAVTLAAKPRHGRAFQQPGRALGWHCRC